MHLLSNQRLARLKSNKRAYEHFLKNQDAYKRYAKHILVLAKEYPALENIETRIKLLASWIIELDDSVWALKTDWMSADEVADAYARLVVGHEL